MYIGGVDVFLYALDTLTGAKKWVYNASQAIWAPPALVGGMVCFGAGGNADPLLNEHATFTA